MTEKQWIYFYNSLDSTIRMRQTAATTNERKWKAMLPVETEIIYFGWGLINILSFMCFFVFFFLSKIKLFKIDSSNSIHFFDLRAFSRFAEINKNKLK